MLANYVGVSIGLEPMHCRLTSILYVALPTELTNTIKKHTVAAALKASDLMDVPHPVCLFMADRRGIEPRPA